MTRIKKGGRELTVSDSVVAEYLNEGYSVIDDKGNEISRSEALTYDEAMNKLNGLQGDLKASQEALAEANRKIAALESELHKGKMTRKA